MLPVPSVFLSALIFLRWAKQAGASDNLLWCAWPYIQRGGRSRSSCQSGLFGLVAAFFPDGPLSEMNDLPEKY